ncbi:MAG: rod shape-determining protein MreC [Candidatus Puniceispirillales bacterium]
MNQQRKFENNKLIVLTNIGQRSLYFGLIIITFLIMFIGKADLAIIKKINIIISDLSSPIISSFSNQTKIIGNSFNYLSNTASLKEENQNLYLENMKLKKYEILSNMYESENLLLKNQLNLVPQNIPNFITARAISAPGNIFAHSLLINSGRSVGIEKGNAVMFNGMFIGQIVSVGNNSSRVLLISDVNSMIPVVVSNNRIPSILIGENLILPSLKFLPNNVKLNQGSIVQTSGHGGLLPAGLPIGTVVKHSSEKNYVKPLIDLNLIDYLQVLLWRADGVNNNENYRNFRPLNSQETINLLEGVTSRGVID